MYLLRTQLRPRQPVTTTTTTTSTERCCYENWERERDERREMEEAFLDARPHLSLLQAVYCDPCKTKVICFLSVFNFLLRLSARW